MTLPDRVDETAGITLDVPIRWGDMDAMGHINNTVYFRFCESARVAYFDALDLDAYKTKPTDGPGLVAASLNFRRQMRYPGTVRVRANITQVSSRSFTITYRLTDAAGGQFVADGTSVCVWVDYQAEKALPLPAALVEAMAARERNPGLMAERL